MRSIFPNMRPLSQKGQASTARKPEFQTKLKSRLGGHSETRQMNASVDESRFMRTQRSQHDHSACREGEDRFNKTASKLYDSNFSHHDDVNCVCHDCNCGRHLCKMHVIKPDLTKNTIYQRSFMPQRQIPNLVNHDKEYEKLRGPHLDLNSTYHAELRGKSGDKLERPLPEDLLKTGGPCPQLSSYSSQFPGYRGDNQYVRPTNKHARGQFPLRSKSTYANEFVKKDSLKDDYTYFPDQLRSKSNWFGKSTYENFFSNPNPEYFAQKVKVVEKIDKKHDFAHQYGIIGVIQKLSTKTTS